MKNTAFLWSASWCLCMISTCPMPAWADGERKTFNPTWSSSEIRRVDINTPATLHLSSFESLVSQPKSLNLSVTYAQRIEVPKGSDLEVTVFDGKGVTVFRQKSLTTTEYPPYTLRVSLGVYPSFPLRIVVRLKSKIGHRFAGTIEANAQTAMQQLKIRMLID